MTYEMVTRTHPVEQVHDADLRTITLVCSRTGRVHPRGAHRAPSQVFVLHSTVGHRCLVLDEGGQIRLYMLRSLVEQLERMGWAETDWYFWKVL